MTATNFYALFKQGRRGTPPPEHQPTPRRPSSEGIHPYAAAAIAEELDRLAQLPRPWREGANWDITTFEVACNLIEIANSPWAGYTITQAQQDLYTHAPQDDTWGRTEHEQKWHSAHKTVAGTGREQPEPLAPLEVTPLPQPLPAISDTESSTDSSAGSDDTNGSSSETGAHNATAAEPSEHDTTSQLEEWRKLRLAQEIEEQRIRREARRLVTAEEAAANWREPAWFPTLTEELQQPDEPVTYLVDEIVPTGANVLLTAQYKTGKTTLINNLTKALADGEPFLDRFDTTHTEGRVAIWNYEVDERQYRRWLRELNITNTDKVTVLNLRGYRMPVIHEQIEHWMTTWLRQHEITTWIMDPFARAFVGSGTSENDNTEVGTFLDTLDVIKHEAGVSELILPTHTGRGDQEKGAERARGATRLDDWADVRWLLVKDEHEARYFRATGRDVDFEEEKLDFNHDTRTLTLAGGDRAWEKRRREQKAVVDIVAAQPGMGVVELRSALRESGIKGKNERLDSIVQNAIYEGDIRTETMGKGQAVKHYANQVRTLPDDT